MQEVLLDVTRLALRRFQGRLPTGIDRVGLKYVEHFGHRARAVLIVNGVPVACRRATSMRLFEWLLGSERAPFMLAQRSMRGLAGGASGDASSGALGRASSGASSGALASIAGMRPSHGNGQLVGRWFLNVVHRGLDSARYLQALERMRVRPLYLIHDLIPITHPEYCRDGEQARHRMRILGALRSAHALVTNSGHTLQRLREFSKAEGLALPPTACAQLAAAVGPGGSARGAKGDASMRRTPAFLAGSRGTTTTPCATEYFLCIGTIEPRKNHMLLLHVWRRLKQQLGDGTPRLVLVGQPGWECEHVTRVLDRSTELRGVVELRQQCSDEELNGLMNGARALLMPSFEEGFGLPIAEALQRGVPVIASDLSVYREFAGDAPRYLDPLDTLGWLRAVQEASAPAVRGAATFDGAARTSRNAQPPALPTWEQHFAAVEALMAAQSQAQAA